jgi:Arc/MetJ-type ribon-helix-helix transcriptional regulator
MAWPVMTCMAVITVWIDEETKRMMDGIDVNWSEVIRRAIRRRIEEEGMRNLAKAVLINEDLRRASRGEMRAEEIIREFRDGRHGKDRH